MNFQHIALSNYTEDHHYNDDVRFVSKRNSLKLHASANITDEYKIKNYTLNPYLNLALSYDFIKQPKYVIARTTKKQIKVVRPVDNIYDALSFNIALVINYNLSDQSFMRAGISSDIGQKYAKTSQIYANFKINL